MTIKVSRSIEFRSSFFFFFFWCSWLWEGLRRICGSIWWLAWSWWGSYWRSRIHLEFGEQSCRGDVSWLSFLCLWCSILHWEGAVVRPRVSLQFIWWLADGGDDVMEVYCIERRMGLWFDNTVFRIVIWIICWVYNQECSERRLWSPGKLFDGRSVGNGGRARFWLYLISGYSTLGV